MEFYFITGVSSGIGLALVKELLRQPQELMIYGYARRDPGIGDPRFLFHAIDLSDISKVEKQATDFFKVNVNKSKRVVLINNAGTLGNMAFTGDQQFNHYTTAFAINTLAPAILCEAFIKAYQAMEGEKIIFNISSGAATKDIEGWAAYCASKAALDRFTTVCAQEQTHKERPVLVYSVSPGVIDTAMQAEIRNSSKENFPAQDRFIKLHQNGELLPANDAAYRIIRLLNTQDLRKSTMLSLRDV